MTLHTVRALTDPMTGSMTLVVARRGVLFCAAIVALLLAGAVPAARAQETASFGRDMARGFVVVPVLWQQGPRPGGPPPDGRGPRGRPLPPALLLERLKSLPPAEREKVLENNPRFQQLPPGQQEKLRERLRQLPDMTAEQRELIEQRFAIFNNLTPQQQEKAREIYERRWSKLAPARRRVLLQEFRRLRALAESQRKERMESSDLQDQFSADERELLAQLISL